MNPKPIKKMSLGVSCTWKGFYTLSQVILTFVVVRIQFSIYLKLFHPTVIQKKPLDFFEEQK